MPNTTTTTTTTGVNNSSANSIGIYSVEQGPTALATYLMNTPLWLEYASIMLALLVFSAIVYRLHQNDWEIPLERQSSMAYLAGVVVCTILGTRLAMGVLDADYVVDVVAGVVLGQLGPQAAVHARRRGLVAGYDRVEVMVLGWGVLACVALVGPVVLPVESGPLALSEALWTLGFLGMGMAVYNMYREQHGG